MNIDKAISDRRSTREYTTDRYSYLDNQTRELRFNMALLSSRLVKVIDWMGRSRNPRRSRQTGWRLVREVFATVVIPRRQPPSDACHTPNGKVSSSGSSAWLFGRGNAVTGCVCSIQTMASNCSVSTDSK